MTLLAVLAFIAAILSLTVSVSILIIVLWDTKRPQFVYSSSPPHPPTNVIWFDTTLSNTWIAKYWDNTEWVRMDAPVLPHPDSIVSPMLSPELREKLNDRW